MSSILTLNGNVLTANGSAITGVASSSNAQSSKSYTVSSSGIQTISPDSGYDAMEAVALTVPSQTLPTNTDVSATTGYIKRGTLEIASAGSQYLNITSGYQDNDRYYEISVPSGSATTPATTITADPSISVTNDGHIVATVSKTQNITPTVSAGYISSGTAGTITISGTESTAMATTPAQTIYPGLYDYTVSPGGTYNLGMITVKGDTNFIASNIKKDVTIFGKTGTYEGEGGGYITVTDTTDTAGGTIRTITPVEGTAVIQSSKSVTINSNTTTTITPDTGNTALGEVVVTTNISGGGGNPTAEENDVIFIDYDGTIRYSYTAAQFANLTELPANPTHDGLTAQGWNWTLSDAKSYVSTYGRHCIGQNYTTTDGATRIYVEIDNNTKQPYMGLGVNGTVTIDWGDGSSTETLTGTSTSTIVWSNQHTYTSAGSYCIKLTPASGTSFNIIGNSNTESSLKTGSALFRYSPEPTYLNTTYRYCIKAVLLGDNTDIYSYAFYDCRSLKYVTIHTSIKSAIPTYSFYNCYSLKAAVVPNNITTPITKIGSYCFDNSFNISYISLPKSLTTLESYGFAYCYTLNFLALPPDMTSYNTYGLSHCYTLQSLVGKLPYRTTTSGSTLPNYFYEYCYGLRDISNLLPSSTTSTGAYTFEYCYGLRTVTFPSNITTIGSYAFQYCRGMESVTFPSNITTIGSYAFQYCSALTSVTIPSNVTTFNTSGYQFRGCAALTSATFNNSVTTVPTYCFHSCTSLTSIKFPTGCTTIGSYCFTTCTSLRVINIPSTVTSIGNYAFSSCTSMEEIHFASTTPPTIGGSSTFNNLPTTCKIYVPTGTLSAYTSQSNMPSSSTYTYIEE